MRQQRPPSLLGGGNDASNPKWHRFAVIGLELTRAKTAGRAPRVHGLWDLHFAYESTLMLTKRAMMAGAKLPKEIKPRVYAEAFGTATRLDGLKIVEIDGVEQTRYKHWCGMNSAFVKNLRPWGEAGAIMNGNKEAMCVFIGYALDKSGYVSRMWDTRTKQVHETRNVRWTKRMFFRPVRNDCLIVNWNTEESVNEIANTNENVEPESEEAREGNGNNNDDDSGSSDNDEPAVAEQTEEEMTRGQNEETVTTRSGRSVAAPRRLIEEIGSTAI